MRLSHASIRPTGRTISFGFDGQPVEAQDRVILDSLSHRSLVDACRLAGVPLQRFKHNDMDSLRQEIASGGPSNRTLIISDGVFSMDGDICPLPELVRIKRETGCFLMIDESHASGVLGRHGRGTDEHFAFTEEQRRTFKAALDELDERGVGRRNERWQRVCRCVHSVN